MRRSTTDVAATRGGIPAAAESRGVGGDVDAARTSVREGRPAEYGPDEPLVSILVLSWNTRELTLRCLDSIPRGVGGEFPYEVIVLDNASSDGSAEALALRNDIRYIRNSQNVGYAAGVNQAYRASAGALVLLLNSDVQLKPGSLAALVRFLDAHPRAAGVAPVYLNPDGTVQDEYALLPTVDFVLPNVSALFSRLPRFARRLRKFKMLDEDFSRPRPVPQPAASCLLLRRRHFSPEFLMDERYPIYFNDVELAQRVRDRQLELWMTPEAVVVHDHGASGRKLGSAHSRQYVGSLIRYLRSTEPWHRVAFLRLVLLLEYAARRAVGHPRALPLNELWRAVSGDPGPIPQAPSDRPLPSG